MELEFSGSRLRSDATEFQLNQRQIMFKNIYKFIVLVVFSLLFTKVTGWVLLQSPGEP
jgi:hypothetical protein